MTATVKMMRFRNALREIGDKMDENRLLNMRLALLDVPEIKDQLPTCRTCLEVFELVTNPQLQLASPDNPTLLEHLLERLDLFDEANHLRRALGLPTHEGGQLVTSAQRGKEQFSDLLAELARSTPGERVGSLKLLCNKVLSRDERRLIRAPADLFCALARKSVISTNDTCFLEMLLHGEGLHPLADQVKAFAQRRPAVHPTSIGGEAPVEGENLQ